MIKPTIHLNGTSATALAEAYENAVSALFRARDALVLAAPNARDYYPQGPNAFSEARRDHDRRAKALHDLQDELQELAEHAANHIKR